MSIVQTYPGVVHQGRIQLTSKTELPEGSRVFVSMVEEVSQATLLDPQIARRKANGWMVTYVGSVMAQQPQLKLVESHLVWQFKAFLAIQGQPLLGPVGQVIVDAYSGEVLADE